MRRFIYRMAAVSVGLSALACLTVALPARVTTGARVGSGIAYAASLSVGDMAPAISVKEFVKGAPVPTLPKGEVSVVEFWATWCGPCKMSIPHLTELAKQYPKVTFVGVSVWEQDQAKVAPFVKEMGEKMDYHVAMDTIPAGAKDGMEGTMAKTWMAAAGQDGIPTAFIVGKDGKIAWIGHPMEMAEPLAKITAGNWDIAAAKAEMQKKQAEQEAMTALQQDLQKASTSKDPKDMIAVLDKAIAKNPDLEKGQIGILKFNILRRSGDNDAAITYGKHLVEVLKDDSEALNSLAWSLVDPAAKVKATAPYLALGLDAAKQADAATKSKNGEIADTLAAAYYANGDILAAVAAETRAIKLVGSGNADEVAQMQKQLDVYSKAALVNK